MAIRNKFKNNCLLSNRSFAIHIKLATADVECINSLKQTEKNTSNKKHSNSEWAKNEKRKRGETELWETTK